VCKTNDALSGSELFITHIQHNNCTTNAYCVVQYTHLVYACTCMITFSVSHRRREMYCGHGRLCVCLSAAACLHFVTWRSGGGCPLVVHYWTDLQSVHGLRCYGNTRNVWQSQAVIRQAHRTPHAVPHTTHAGEDSPRQP